jgi:hypothetical protein
MANEGYHEPIEELSDELVVEQPARPIDNGLGIFR